LGSLSGGRGVMGCLPVAMSYLTGVWDYPTGVGAPYETLGVTKHWHRTS